MIEINMCGMKNLADNSSTVLENAWDPWDFICVYVLERDDDSLEPHEEIISRDFNTTVEASVFFQECETRWPDAELNIYSMPREN